MKHIQIAKRIGALALCAALTVGVLTMGAGAAGTNVTAQLSPDITVVVDGAVRTFYNAGGEEVHPIAYNGTTYLPIRAIGELMDKNVNWDQSSLTVSISGARTAADVAGTPDRNAMERSITAALWPDITVMVDGVERTFTDAQSRTVYPLVYHGSVYLPVRAIGNLMGKNVSWDGATETVTLSGELLITDADSFQEGDRPGTSGQGTASGLITEEQAKSKALAHAGLSASQVNFIWVKQDWEDGRRVYEVEFYTDDYQEYDYEIDARTGEILSFDYDAEGYNRPEQNLSGSYIGQDKAASIALSYVSGATQANVRSVKLDWDDGRAEYEVTIIYGTTEYGFEINAYTGAVLSRDMESIYD